MTNNFCIFATVFCNFESIISQLSPIFAKNIANNQQ